MNVNVKFRSIRKTLIFYSSTDWSQIFLIKMFSLCRILSPDFAIIIRSCHLLTNLESLLSGILYVHCVSKKFPPLNSLQLCQTLIDFQNFCTLESVWNLLQNTFDITRLTLGMLLHYLGKWQNSNFLKMWKKDQTNCIWETPLTLLFIHRF